MYKCEICGTEFKTEHQKEYCERQHEFIYIEIKRADLFNLLQFIATRDTQLLSPSLIKTLQKYSKGYYAGKSN